MSGADPGDAGGSPRTAVPGGSGTVRERDPGWDVLRTCLVLMVVIYHATYLAPVIYPELLPRRFEFSHQVGASLLLVVSAYFACMTIGRRSAWRYWWARAARLVPAFLVAVPLAWAVMRYLSPAEWYTPGRRDLVGNWLLLGNWKPDAFPFLDGAYWTLPLQLMGFTVAALLWATRWGHGRRLRVVLWTAVLLPLAQWPIRAHDPPETYRMIVDGFGFHRLHLFVAGVAVWLWATRRMRSTTFVPLIALCAAAQFVHALNRGPDGWDEDWIGTVSVCAGIGVIALIARFPVGARVVPSPLAAAGRWLAGISYGVYLTHQTVGFVLMRHLQDHGVGPTLQSAAMLASAVALGWLLTRGVEQPCYTVLLRAYDHLADRRRAPRLRTS